MDVLSSTEQEIHVVVKVKASNLSWLLTAVYASPRVAERNVLWQNLISVAKLHNMPWTCFGDFNDIIAQSNRKNWGGDLLIYLVL